MPAYLDIFTNTRGLITYLHIRRCGSACGDYDGLMQSANKSDHIDNWLLYYLPVFHIRITTRATGSRMCLLCGGINLVAWVVIVAPVIADRLLDTFDRGGILCFSVYHVSVRTVNITFETTNSTVNR